MTLDRPSWLLLLLALPLLWWLHRRLRAPREVVVAAVAALRGAHVQTARGAARRVLDVDLALLLAAVALLALSAAGLRTGGDGAAILVALDTSASMRVRPGGAGGEDLLGLAWRVARERAANAAPDADLVVVDLDVPQNAERMPVSGAPAPPPTASGGRGGVDDLPASLVPVLERARREGFPGVLLLTDRVLDLGADIVLSGPGVEPPRTAAVVGAILDGERALVTVLRGAETGLALETEVEGRAATRVAVPGGEGLATLHVAAPPRGGAATYRVLGGAGGGPMGALHVTRVGGVSRVRISGPGRAAPRQRALLAALSIEVTESVLDTVEAELVVGGPATAPAGDDPPRLHVAVAPAVDTEDAEDGGVAVRAGRGVLSAARIAAAGELAESVPAPGVTFERRGVLDLAAGAPRGTWTAPDGIVAAVLPRRIVTTLDPEASSSTWHADASFPVFYLRAFELLAGGPDRLRPTDALPLSEIVRAGPPPAPATRDRVASLVRVGGGAQGSRAMPALLALLAAGAVVGAALRGTRRFSGA